MRVEGTFHERIDEWLIRAAVKARSSLARFLRPGSLIVLAVVTATGVVALLHELSVPSKRAWRPGHPLVLGLAVVGGLAYVGYFLVIVGYRRTLKQSDQERRLYRDLHRLGALEPLGDELARRVRGDERVGDLLEYLSVSEWVELGYTVFHMAGERVFTPHGSEELLERMRRRALLRREYGIPVDVTCASTPPTPGCNCLIVGLDTWEGDRAVA